MLYLSAFEDGGVTDPLNTPLPVWVIMPNLIPALGKLCYLLFLSTQFKLDHPTPHGIVCGRSAFLPVRPRLGLSSLKFLETLYDE